jgi:chaperone modulatory protein CbpM
MEAREFLMQAHLDDVMLTAWIDAEWLHPRSHAGIWRFSEVDLARAQLIRDLKQDLGVNDEGVTVILDLVDQINGIRRLLGRLLPALHTLPASPRQHPASPE